MTVATADDSLPISVVTSLYFRTKALHTEAERTGVIRDLLRGDASRESYIVYMRNLLPVYQALERGLERHRDSPALATLRNYRFDRAPALETDLVALAGETWDVDVPLLPSGDIYASRVAMAADGDGTRLIAHAYTRYLGDLSGGLILRRLLARSLGLRPAELSFYDFARFSDLAAVKADYRKALDHAGTHAADPRAVVEEGAIAFLLNIDVSVAVQRATSSAAISASAAE